MKILDRTVRVATLVWLVAHFTLTLLYVMPANPMRMNLEGLLNLTIGTFFGQNWNLFAPDPLATDYALLVRCVDGGERGALTEENLPSEGWHDLSSPMWKRFRVNRFSAYDRLSRTQLQAIRQFVSGGPGTSDWRRACQRGDEGACEVLERLMELARADAELYLRRIGSAFCFATARQPREISHVGLRIRQREPVPWSKRHEIEELEAEDFSVGVYEVDPDVDPFPLFYTGGDS